MSASWAAAVQTLRLAPVEQRAPVLFVHGLGDDASAFDALRQRLEQEGWPHLHALSLAPSDGSESLSVLARQVAHEAQALRARTGARRVDVVAFSMGALVTRYWVQLLGGRLMVRRFISISGPHGGSALAFLARGKGITQMRPGSRLLRALQQDTHPWGNTEVHSFWSPWDLMIVPASSSRLPGACERVFPVLFHPWMLTDGRVHDAVVEVLGSPAVAR
ncbi:lipase class 2 [Myxococcus stipitatus DSM 14675]|uniref:Lipase class 2 n=1 Tax=Myxococcus stipitatus (strain DSM 14675 / JCM 12634 / Mx s8) TaxID=1278073 RepID=L7U621_MYXSD|nr:alpha/beta fold hydrolase [Myxococcus stipitatus]AGC43558.1 lipase class 2 [Myxococcus stipitatus DSM 14675]